MRILSLKKIILVMAMLLAGIGCQAANSLAGSYYSSILGREFYVFYNGMNAMVYVAGPKKIDRVQFVIKRADIREFNSAMTAAEEAYMAYRDSDTTETVPADAMFPPIQVRWRTTKWHGRRNHHLVPYLSRLADGTPVLLFGNKITSADGMEKEYSLAFANLQEVEEFKALLDPLKR